MKTKDIFERCRATRDAQGVAKISAKEVAALIRDQLRKQFPGVAFSVTSTFNKVSIRWTNGPIQTAVLNIVEPYNFGGFDGAIDLAYQGKNWLLPDGRMTFAHTSGTVGSMGCVSARGTDCPEPGAILVEHGPQYVFAQRHVSEERYAELSKLAIARYGEPVNPEDASHNQVLRTGEYLWRECLRLEAATTEA